MILLSFHDELAGENRIVQLDHVAHLGDGRGLLTAVTLDGEAHTLPISHAQFVKRLGEIAAQFRGQPIVLWEI